MAKAGMSVIVLQCVVCVFVVLCSIVGLQLLSKSDCVTSHHAAASAHKHTHHSACACVKFPCHWIEVVSHPVFKDLLTPKEFHPAGFQG